VTYDRQVIAYKNYFLDFYEKQPDNVQSKIEWTLNLIRVTRQVPEKYFKHLEGTNGLYEIRVEVGNNIYRIFSFFDKGNLVVLGNAFQKKSPKTPRQELEKAIRIIPKSALENYYNTETLQIRSLSLFLFSRYDYTSSNKNIARASVFIAFPHFTTFSNSDFGIMKEYQNENKK
jgi:phage-related protein